MVSVAVILAGVLFVPGCATRKHVRSQVETLQPAIQEANNAARENAERIDVVDRRAQEGISAAQQAASAARTADQRAGEANTAAQTAQQSAQSAGRAAETANQAVQQANARIKAVEGNFSALEGRLSRIDNYTATETQTITFPFDSSDLSKEAKDVLDRIAAELSGLRAGYMIELKGFTDSTGRDNYNLGLSERRTQSVVRYLTDKNVPLFRISVVGFGEDNPVGDNKTRGGREQNRRVEITVLRAASGSGASN
jgi:outer membrane protein OmpA-like peptidoglycan-associated protein